MEKPNLTTKQKSDAVTDRTALRDVTKQSDNKNVVWPDRLENEMESDILIGIFMGKRG